MSLNINTYKTTIEIPLNLTSLEQKPVSETTQKVNRIVTNVFLTPESFSFRPIDPIDPSSIPELQLNIGRLSLSESEEQNEPVCKKTRLT